MSELEFYRASTADAFDFSVDQGFASPAFDEQFLASIMWKAVTPEGQVVALLGFVLGADVRVAWIITSPPIKSAVRCFINQTRRLLDGLARSGPLLIPISAQTGRKLVKLVGGEFFIICRDGVEYWIKE